MDGRWWFGLGHLIGLILVLVGADSQGLLDPDVRQPIFWYGLGIVTISGIGWLILWLPSISWLFSQKLRLKLLFEPVEFGQNYPPYGELQVFLLSNLDSHFREMMEIEKKLPSSGQIPSSDKTCPFFLYRIGIKNFTGRTVWNVKLELSTIRDIEDALLPTSLRLLHSVDAAINLAHGESAFFDVVSAPILAAPLNEKDRNSAVTELILHYSKQEYPRRIPLQTYDFCITARGDGVNPEQSWFRLEVKDDASIDFYEIGDNSSA